MDGYIFLLLPISPERFCVILTWKRNQRRQHNVCVNLAILSSDFPNDSVLLDLMGTYDLQSSPNTHENLVHKNISLYC